MNRYLRVLAAALLVVVGLAACGGDDTLSEEDAVDVLASQLESEGALDAEQSQCVAQEIVDEIGVDGLEDIGLSTGGSGNIEDMSEEEQTKMFDLVGAAFDTCNVVPAAN